MDGLLIHGKLMPQRNMFQAQQGMRPEQRSYEGQGALDLRRHRYVPRDQRYGRPQVILISAIL
jgi:hypothetical protein